MYGFAQGMGDFLKDFNDESGKIRESEAKKASDDAAIEQRALEHLANADDPDIRAAAVTSMLTPKKSGGGSGLMKWFGQQRDHPVFDQVHALVNGGRQPFMSEEDKAAAAGRGRETGRIGGANQAYSDVTGENLPNEDLRRMAMGSVGAPPGHITPTRPGVITLEDGTQVAGSFDPVSQMYTDSDGTTLSGVKDFHPNGSLRPANTSTGGKWMVEPDQNSPSGYSNVHRDATGKELARTSNAMAPQAPPNAIMPTAGGGITAVAPGRAGGAPPRVIPIQGGENVVKPEPSSVSFEALRNMANDVEKRARASVAHFGALPPNDAKLKAALDREAKVSGFNSWQDLQNQVSAGQRAIQGSTQAAPGAPKPAAPPGKGRGTAPAKGSQLDISKILEELNKIQ